jgi:hypothetical protein
VGEAFQANSHSRMHLLTKSITFKGNSSCKLFHVSTSTETELSQYFISLNSDKSYFKNWIFCMYGEMHKHFFFGNSLHYTHLNKNLLHLIVQKYLYYKTANLRAPHRIVPRTCVFIYAFKEDVRELLIDQAICLLVSMLYVGNWYSRSWVSYSVKAEGLLYLAKVQAYMLSACLHLVRVRHRKASVLSPVFLACFHVSWIKLTKIRKIFDEYISVW